MTKKDLTILLSYSANFQMLTNCNNNNNNNNNLLLNIKMIIIRENYTLPP